MLACNILQSWLRLDTVIVSLGQIRFPIRAWLDLTEDRSGSKLILVAPPSLRRRRILRFQEVDRVIGGCVLRFDLLPWQRFWFHVFVSLCGYSDPCSFRSTVRSGVPETNRRPNPRGAQSRSRLKECLREATEPTVRRRHR